MTVRSTILVVVLASTALYVSVLRGHEPAAAPTPPFQKIPMWCGDYAGSAQTVSDRTMDVLGADEVMYRRYMNPEGRIVWLFLGYFSGARENAQVHSPEHCYPGSGWDVVDEGSAAVRVGGRPLRVKRLYLANGNEHQVVLYWFRSSDGVLRNEYALKWDQMMNALAGRSQQATFVRFSTPVPPGQKESESLAELERFASELSPAIEAVFTESGDPSSSRSALGAQR